MFQLFVRNYNNHENGRNSERLTFIYIFTQ
jgi:hypothetical protein